MADVARQALSSEVQRLATLVRQLQGGVLSGDGSPEGIVEAGVGTLYTDRSGGAGSVLYVKESSPTPDTGWVAK
jgi:hypothetical protein